MNVFWLDRSPTLAARYHADVHVPKMLLESCQFMMTVKHASGQKASWAPFNVNHPHVRWACESAENYWQLYQLASSLEIEYAVRFHKRHLCGQLLHGELFDNPCKATGELSIPPFVGPKQYSGMVEPELVGWDRVVQMYRLYYYHGKGAICSWSNREMPWWWFNRRNLNGLE